MEKVEPHLQTILNQILPASWTRYYLSPYLLVTTSFLPSLTMFEAFKSAYEAGLKEFSADGQDFVLTFLGLGFQKWKGDGFALMTFGVTLRGHRTVIVSFCTDDYGEVVTQTLGRLRVKLLQREFRPSE